MRLADVTGKSKSIYKYTGSNEFVIPNQYLGVEVELEGITPGYRYSPEFLHYWTMKEDGSLRSSPTGKVGVEYVFKDALFGQDAVEALRLFEVTMKALTPDPSFRCGLHVHVDTSDMSVDALFNFVFLYMMYESALYNYLGENRKDSPFCVPLTTYTDSTDNLIAMLKTIYKDYYSDDERKQRLYKQFERWSKYNGLNLLSLVRYGTVEFRQAPSTYSAAKIKKWINIILCLKLAAQTTDAKFTKEFHKYISQVGVGQLSRDVFKNHLEDILYSTFYDDVSANIKFIQHIIVSMNKEKISTKIKKDATKLGLSERMHKLLESEPKPKPKRRLGGLRLNPGQVFPDNWEP